MAAAAGQPAGAGGGGQQAPGPRLDRAGGGEMQTVSARTAGLQKHDGFIPFYWDARRGVLLLELSPQALDREFLYFTALGSGMGTLDVGGDRSSFGGSALARFMRVGPRVLLIEENERFRAPHGSPALQHSVELSFPTSVLVAMQIEAEQDGTVLVNGNPLLMHDAFNLLGRLRQPGQNLAVTIPGARPAAPSATWRLDEARSVVDLEHTRSFPLNTELEALLTFASDAGQNLNQPDARALSVRQHQSFVQMPEPGFEPRERDPRVGFFGPAFEDFSQPFDRPLTRQFIDRWRLQKKDPNAALSEPVKPLTYYLDPAVPEPIRSALRRGALWWNDAFQQAGFRNAFRVEDLPPDADPLDVRYPTIQWTNRVGRGWSVGQSQVDPRTGEIIHAVVQLDSHRMRTQHRFWEATQPATMAGAMESDDELSAGDWADFDSVDPQTSDEQVMLNRLALLAAHEVGHTLGLEHNFIASTYGRGSVMEYYAPRIKIRGDGTADLSDAWMQGVGAYDKFAIEWGYSQRPANSTAEQERTRLNAIVKRHAIDAGHAWASAQDPRWNAYDDGPDPVSWLRDVMPVRDALLKNFGPQMLRTGESNADLGNLFPLMYMFHQYGLGAAVNVVGSAKIPPSLKGDGQVPVQVWPVAQQREALKLLAEALSPKELEISPQLWLALAPLEGGFGGDPERFRSSAGYLFAPQDGARAVCELVIGGLLDAARVQRIVTIAHETQDALAATEVVNALVDAAFQVSGYASAAGKEDSMLAGVVQSELADRFMMLASDANASPEAQAVGWMGVDKVEAKVANSTNEMHRRIAAEIANFRRDPKGNAPRPRPSGAPPGPPIG
ncbi:MAG: zinc-dependent metalloprotease [Acidobacteria bacterium]|nr:zinc-dependent metalloprotease [Acidobacteriota bacterium]